MIGWTDDELKEVLELRDRLLQACQDENERYLVREMAEAMIIRTGMSAAQDEIQDELKKL